MKTFKEYLIAEATEDDTSQEEASIANASKTVNDMRKILRQGVNRLLKLDHPQQGEDLDRHASRTVDAYDMLESMEVLRKFFEETKDLVGVKMRRGDTTFDYVDDIKLALQSYYLKGATEKAGALSRRKYRALVMLLLDPIVDLFKKISHDDALAMYDNVIDQTIRFIKNSDIVTSADDAFVQRRLIAKEVQRRNRVAKAVVGIIKLRKKAKGKKKRKAAK